METEHLRLLISIARLGGFAAAARAHDLDPSTVSRITAQVEQALGARLFQRSTRRLSLTETGAQYLRRIEPILDELDQAREEAQGGTARAVGRLRLTASTAYGQARLMPLLRPLRDAFPELSLELILADEPLDLIRERIDLAIRLAPAVEGDLVCARLHGVRYRVCASPRYIEEAGRPESPAALAERLALLQDLPAYRSRWIVRDAAGAESVVAVSPGIVISSALGVRDAALEGLGPALLADWLADPEIAAGRLVDLFPDHAVAAASFETAAWIVYPSRAFLPAKTRLVIDFLRARLGG